MLIGSDRNDAGISLDPETLIGDTTAIGIYITFRVSSLSEEEVQDKIIEENEVRRSAFGLLMTHAREKINLPDRVTQIRGNKDRLTNKIIDWMEKNSLYFHKQSVATVGNELSTAIMRPWCTRYI